MLKFYHLEHEGANNPEGCRKYRPMGGAGGPHFPRIFGMEANQGSGDYIVTPDTDGIEGYSPNVVHVCSIRHARKAVKVLSCIFHAMPKRYRLPVLD